MYFRNNKDFCSIGLDNPKNSINVGSVIRAADNYGASFVSISGRRIGPGITDTSKAYRRIPFFRVANLHDIIPFDCIPVAVDLVEGATSLPDYIHPERAFYIFGAEDATLSNRVISWCRDKVYIPTNGCMNLAATVNVVLYDRMVKRNDNK